MSLPSSPAALALGGQVRPPARAPARAHARTRARGVGSGITSAAPCLSRTRVLAWLQVVRQGRPDKSPSKRHLPRGGGVASGVGLATTEPAPPRGFPFFPSEFEAPVPSYLFGVCCMRSDLRPACFLASGALRPTSAHDVRDGSGAGRPLQPTPRRRRAEGGGGTGPPRRHGLNTHTGGRVRHRVEGKRLLSIRIVPRVLRSLQLDDPLACVARAFLCLCRPCTS